MYLFRKNSLTRTFTTFVIAFAILTGSLILPTAWIPETLVSKADNVSQTLPFSQDWSNTGLITTNDIWSGVAGIEGFFLNSTNSTTGIDPRTVTTDVFNSATTTVDLDVIANQTNPNTLSNGGVAEFHSTLQSAPASSNPVVALNGSGTADAPFILVHLNTVGQSNVNVSYNLRDIDCTVDDATQPVALMYRIGNSGAYTNLAAGFVADASARANSAATDVANCTLVTPVNVTLPAAAENQSLVQLRIISTNAAGNDEWIGIDDIQVTGNGNPANVAPTITAPANPIATVDENAAPFTVGLTGNDDGGVYNWSATAGTGVQSVTVTSGQGTANVGFQVTLQNDFSGTATFTASLSDNVNSPATQAVNISVTPLVQNDPPVITPPANPITTVAQDAAPFTVSLSGSDDNNIFNWSALAGSGVSNVSVTGGQGTASVTYTVTLQTGFSGTASFTASLSDGVNPTVNQAVNISVTAAPPPPVDHIVISQVYGGGGNASASYQNDFVELYNPTASTVDVSGWSVQYGSATGSTWQVQTIGGPIGPGEYLLVSMASGGANGAELPPPNIDGSINMSATNGKVALVSNGTPLSGCQTSAPVVDLVGYGGTANCREGATNAPGPSGGTVNTNAIFRKTGGLTDTNVNGADFELLPAAPRRTAPITELGPWVASSDPISNQTTAPKDDTISVFFSEPVDADGAWFDISCASTGSHNSATVAHTTDFKTWAITPNNNFQYGEQCTVVVYKDQIHDQDTDDSNPNTDTLFADYSWSFTVVQAGAPAPYPSSVHLTLGNPSNAVTDINQPNNYLMEKESFTLSYNRDKATPNWVSWHLEPAWYGTLSRVDTFRADPAVPAEWYRVTGFDYTFSGFDRGHMTPNADRDHQNSLPLNQATYLMTNMIPQAPDNNQGPWADMENDLRTIADANNEVYIVSGPAGQGGTGSNGSAQTISGGRIVVPAFTWKAALVLPRQSGDDISRIDCSARAIAVIMPNVQGIREANWQSYMTNVDAIEELTGYDLFSNVPANIQSCLEANTDGVNDPPVAQPQSVTTNEDTSLSITLTATDPDSSLLTYTVMNGPSNGTLSGTAPNLTYEPAPNYFGSDSFTFRASDGALNSGTVTVSITVAPTNDAPVVVNDRATQSVEYSDAIQTVEVTASDIETSPSALTASASFSTNGGPTWAPGLPSGLSLAPSDTPGKWLVTGNVSAAAATYEIRVAVQDTDDGSGTTNQPFTSFTIVVAKEKTATDYTGDFDLMTAGPAINTASVQLAAKLTQSNDGYAGDLTRATVTFKIYKFSASTPTYVIPNIAVDAAGEARTTYTLPADTYSILVEVDAANGYWTADPINVGLLSITVPSDEQRSNGGGWVPDPTSASQTASFAFSVSVSKNGQPKGNVSFSFRGNDGFNYLVKGNSWQGGYLQFSAEPGVTPSVYTLAKIKGNCNVQKIDPATGIVVASFGNHSFEMFVRDGDLLNPRQRDSYSIVVRNSSGGVFHSVGSQFSLVELGGGNITNKSR